MSKIANVFTRRSQVFPTSALLLQGQYRGGGTSPTSRAVVEALVETLGVAATQNGLRSSSDAAACAVAFKTLARHLIETGAVRAMDREIRAHPRQVSEEEIGASDLRNLLRQHGIELSIETAEELVSVPAERKRKAAAYWMARGGLTTMFGTVVDFFRTRARELPKGPFIVAQYCQDSGCSNVERCNQLRTVLDTMLLIIAMNSAACVAGCLPCCGIAAAMGVTVALLRLEINSVCS